MQKDDNEAGIKVTLGILGLTGILLLIGTISYLLNQISSRF